MRETNATKRNQQAKHYTGHSSRGKTIICLYNYVKVSKQIKLKCKGQIHKRAAQVEENLLVKSKELEVFTPTSELASFYLKQQQINN